MPLSRHRRWAGRPPIGLVRIDCSVRQRRRCCSTQRSSWLGLPGLCMTAHVSFFGIAFVRTCGPESMDPTRTWFRPPATAGDHFALDVPPAESELRFESVAAYLSLNQLLWNQGKRGYRCFNGSVPRCGMQLRHLV